MIFLTMFVGLDMENNSHIQKIMSES